LDVTFSLLDSLLFSASSLGLYCLRLWDWEEQKSRAVRRLKAKEQGYPQITQIAQIKSKRFRAWFVVGQ